MLTLATAVHCIVFLSKFICFPDVFYKVFRDKKQDFSLFLGLFLLFSPELAAVMEWVYLLLSKTVKVLVPNLLLQQEKKNTVTAAALPVVISFLCWCQESSMWEGKSVSHFWC